MLEVGQQEVEHLLPVLVVACKMKVEHYHQVLVLVEAFCFYQGSLLVPLHSLTVFDYHLSNQIDFL